MFPSVTRLLVACVFAATATQASAVPFSNIYVLGDSLSDQGNLFRATTMIAGPANALPASDHYFAGRFSNGPVYIDVLSQRLGVATGPSLIGGNNFAYGGARTSYNIVETTVGGPLPPGLFPWSLNAEIAAFSSRGINDPNGLYIVFSGSNDVADIVTRRLDPSTLLPNAVGAVLNGVNAFKQAGARTIIVPNIPDLGLTPAFRSNAAGSAAATALSAQFNVLLDAGLDAVTGVDIIEFDTFGFLRQAVSNPAAFGFTNVTTPCYSGFVVPNPSGTECANPDEFLFWDLVHPTAAVHAALAEAIFARIPAAIPLPSSLSLSLLAVLLLAAFAARRRYPARIC